MHLEVLGEHDKRLNFKVVLVGLVVAQDSEAVVLMVGTLYFSQISFRDSLVY